MAEEEKKSSGGSDLPFFFGMLLLFFLVWLAGGGPSRPVSFSGPYLGAITAPGAGATAYGDPNQYGSVNGTISIGNKSVYLLRDASGAKSGSAGSEYVTVVVSAGASGSISTAGWRLVSKSTGEGASFPLGAEVPQSGKVNNLVPITLKPGEQAVVTSGRSPVGVSFKENLCTGYFEERQDFKPALAQSCPTPFQELQRFYPSASEECSSYVRSIPYCATDTDMKGVGGSCEEFVDEYLNYNGCVDAHGGDSNFSGSTWRVYLGSKDDLWRDSRDEIQLVGADGTVIDTLSY